MCGRFTLTTPRSKLIEVFGAYPLPEWTPRFNIAPTDDVLALTHGSAPHAGLFRWGLLPSGAKDRAIGSTLINARAETLAQKFRSALQTRRCLILADGFYEWKREGRQKTPMYIRLKDHAPFAFAGLWDAWQSPAQEMMHSCTIITTEPNTLVAAIHDRMPVILPPAHYDAWLAPAALAPAQVAALLTPLAPDRMEAYRVSSVVNSARHDGPDCIVPESERQGRLMLI